MSNEQSQSVCFRLRKLPDPQSPRLVMAFGERASTVAEQLVLKGLMLVASHARANGNLVFTLRYLIDNGPRAPQRGPYLNEQSDALDIRDRMRIYVILAAETHDLSPSAFSMAAELLRAQLGACFDTGGSQAVKAFSGPDRSSDSTAAVTPVTGDEALEQLPDWQAQFEGVWNSKPSICHVAKREFITLDEIESRTSMTMRSGARPSDAVPQTGLRGVYLPWPYRSDDRDSAGDPLFWDRLADAVAPGGQSATQRQFCVDLVFRPLTLAPGDQVLIGLSAQLARNRDWSGTRTATTDMVGRISQSYWDLCAQGNLFDFGMRVAGSDADAVEWLAGSLATAITGGGRFRVDVLQKDSPEWTASLEAAQQGAFDRGFVQPELRDLDVDLRRIGVKYWSRRLLNTEEGRKLRGTLDNVPALAGLAHLKYLIGADTAGEFLRLPIVRQGYFKTIRLDTETQAVAADRIMLGSETERDGVACIPLNNLTGHMFVTGATGSGKTTTLYHILAQLWETYNIPFLVIEPVKKQYRSLKEQQGYPKLSRDLVVFTVGQNRVTPLRFNPLRFGPVTLNEHLAALEICFRGSMPFIDPLPAIFMEMLEQTYISKNPQFQFSDKTGLQFTRDTQSQDTFPSITNMIDYWATRSAEIMESIGYGSEVTANVRGALVARMKELGQPYLRDLFEPPVLSFKQRFTIADQPKQIDLPLGELLNRPVVLELDALNIRQVNLLTLFILSMIREHRRAQAQSKKLKHVLVIEEAHNLVGRHAGPIAGENYVDPAAAATQFLVQMLAEVRALGQGLIIVDQTPAAVAPEVLKNTNIKLVHRTTDGDDRMALANSMLLSPAQVDEVARLGQGFGYFYQPGLYRPIGVYVNVSNQIAQLGNERVEDANLRKRQLDETLFRLVDQASKTNLTASWTEISEVIKFELYMTMLHDSAKAYMTSRFGSEQTEISKALIAFQNRIREEVDHGVETRLPG